MQFFVYLTMEEGQKRSGPSPSPEKMAEIMKFHEEARATGVMVATGRLSSTATRIRSDGDEVSATDGPFIEGKELIPGFTVIELDTRAEAIQWATAYRALMGMPELRIADVMT